MKKVFQSFIALSINFNGLEGLVLLLYRPPEPTLAPTSTRVVSQI